MGNPPNHFKSLNLRNLPTLARINSPLRFSSSKYSIFGRPDCESCNLTTCPCSFHIVLHFMTRGYCMNFCHQILVADVEVTTSCSGSELSRSRFQTHQRYMHLLKNGMKNKSQYIFFVKDLFEK